MHSSIGVITKQKVSDLPLQAHSFSFKKGTLPTNAETFCKIEQSLHPFLGGLSFTNLPAMFSLLNG